MALYHCKHCGKTVHRNSKKDWIKSCCDQSGYKTVHLVRVRKRKKERVWKKIINGRVVVETEIH